MNKLMLFLFTMFLFTKNLYAIDGINTDFNSIFNNASTEQGKQNIVPTYQGANVPETQINVGNIENETYKSLENNESGQFINNTFNTRPQYDTRQLGNLVDNTNKSIENNESIVNKDYCDPYNDIEYKICYKYSGQNLCPDNTYNKYCKSNLEMQCTSYESGCTTAGLELSSLPPDLEWSYDGGNGTLIIGKKSNANYWNGTCLVVDKTIEFEISNLELVEMFTLNRVVFDDYISVILNDNLIYVGPYGGTKLELITKNSGFLKRTLVDYGTGQNSCELSTIWNQYINKDLTKLLKLGKNTLKMRVIVSGSGQGSMEFILKNRCCKEHVEKWVETCNVGEKSDKCNLLSKVCTKKDYTVKFEGKYIPKKCAEYEQAYTCKSSQESCFLHDNDCNNYNIANCSLESKEFVNKMKETEKFTYRCLTPRATPRDCDQVIRCLDGSCYENQEIQDNTQDMLDAIAMLSTLNESVKTIDADSLTMLNGENLKCKKSTGAVAGFKDCCGDENWGNSLSGCNSNEEKLKEKRNNNDCIYVGNYCSEYVDLGFTEVCVTKKYSYCCFSNKFSKIIGNATRQQGLQTWGNAENTNCDGILINQLQQLDFSKIDFSELYNDIKSSINKDDIERRAQQSLEGLKNNVQ